MPDENGFGIDLSDLEKVGGQEGGREPGALPVARDTFAVTVRTEAGGV